MTIISNVYQKIQRSNENHKQNQQNPIPSKLAQRLVEKQVQFSTNENYILLSPNNNNLTSNSEKIKQSTTTTTTTTTTTSQTSQNRSQSQTNNQMNGSDRRGISSLIHSYSNHLSGSSNTRSNADDHDEDEDDEDDDKRNRGKYQRNINPSKISKLEKDLDDESLSSDSSSSDGDINSEEYDANNSSQQQPVSAADSLIVYFQQTMDHHQQQHHHQVDSSKFDSHSLKSNNVSSQFQLPSYLKSTRSSSRKGQVTTEDVTISKPTSSLKPKYTPFGPVSPPVHATIHAPNPHVNGGHHQHQQHQHHSSGSNSRDNKQVSKREHEKYDHGGSERMPLRRSSSSQQLTSHSNHSDRTLTKFTRTHSNKDLNSHRRKAPLPSQTPPSATISSSTTTTATTTTTMSSSPLITTTPAGSLRSSGSHFGKKNSLGFFEKFSGRIRPPDRGRSGWGAMMEEGFETFHKSRRDSEHLNMSETVNTRTQSSRDQFRSRSREKDGNGGSGGVGGGLVRKSLSPTRLAMIGSSRMNQKADPLSSSNLPLPPSINSLLHQQQSQTTSIRTSKSPQRSSSRSKTPDELHNRRPTPDSQRRNLLTDAAEWSRMSDWLSSIQMEKYCESFRQNGITKLSVVELLQYHDLFQLNIDRNDIPHIMECIEEIRKRTKSFTDQAPLQFLPKTIPVSTILTSDNNNNNNTPPSTSNLNQNLGKSIQTTNARTRIVLSRRNNQNENVSLNNQSLSDKYCLVSPSGTNAIIAIPKLLDLFTQRERSQFFTYWQLIKDSLLTNIISISNEIIIQIHPLEFYFRLSFAISSLSSSSKNSLLGNDHHHEREHEREREREHDHEHDKAMYEFKEYLESLMKSDDVHVTNLLNSRLYAAYGAIILVPNPRSNPAFTHLFEEKWFLGIRKRLETFLKQLYSSVTLSSTDYLKYRRQIQIGFSRSPTNSETELEMMQVLHTMEASEKLHKVLRESTQSGSSTNDATATATKQYRASVPKEHTPVSLQQSKSFITPIQTKIPHGGEEEDQSDIPFVASKQVHIPSTKNAKPKSGSGPKPGRRMSAVLGSGTVIIENINDLPHENTNEDDDEDGSIDDENFLSIPRILSSDSDSDSESGSDNIRTEEGPNTNDLTDNELIHSTTKPTNEEEKEEEEEEEYDFSEEKNFKTSFETTIIDFEQDRASIVNPSSSPSPPTGPKSEFFDRQNQETAQTDVVRPEKGEVSPLDQRLASVSETFSQNSPQNDEFTNQDPSLLENPILLDELDPESDNNKRPLFPTHENSGISSNDKIHIDEMANIPQQHLQENSSTTPDNQSTISTISKEDDQSKISQLQLQEKEEEEENLDSLISNSLDIENSHETSIQEGDGAAVGGNDVGDEPHKLEILSVSDAKNPEETIYSIPELVPSSAPHLNPTHKENNPPVISPSQSTPKENDHSTIPPTSYIQYLKGNFRGLEKTRSQVLREKKSELNDEIEISQTSEDEEEDENEDEDEDEDKDEPEGEPMSDTKNDTNVEGDNMTDILNQRDDEKIHGAGRIVTPDRSRENFLTKEDLSLTKVEEGDEKAEDEIAEKDVKEEHEKEDEETHSRRSQSPKDSDTVEEESDGSVDENHEFCTPLQLQNLTNRGSFVVMTKEEEEMARQRSFNSEDSSVTTPTQKGSGAAKLFKSVSIVSNDSMNERGERESSSSSKEINSDVSPSLEKRKSNISQLIEKFNKEKPQQEEVSWNGWELVGSRWLKRNPITDEELEAAASFYANTNRRHNNNSPKKKKKMKRNSSAEMSNYVTEEIVPTRTRARSIDFWEEPTSLRQFSSSDADMSPKQTRVPFDRNMTSSLSPLPHMTRTRLDIPTTADNTATSPLPSPLPSLSPTAKTTATATTTTNSTASQYDLL